MCYKYLASDFLECALCGSLPKHSASSKGRHVRSIPQPDTINEILNEVGNYESLVSEDSYVCNKCYQFCIQLVEEYSEMHADEHILEALKVKRDELQSMNSECDEPMNLHCYIQLFI